MVDSPLRNSVVALTQFFVGDGTVEQTLQRVSQLTTEAIPAADLVGLTMMVEGHQRTAVFTDDAAPEIDQAQYETGEGPCLAAFETSEIYRIDSTLEAGRWPAFRAAAAEHGVLSTLSLPMIANERPVGAMNLYSRRERAFTDDDGEDGLLFASQAAIVLANAQAYWDERDLSLRLGEAMKSRAIIEQAKGILMAAQGCNEGQAFELLVRASQRENVKLRDVAARIVDTAVARAQQRPT